jgi:leader peptidase (prepilin peptidase) / N-methyltransferase
MHAAIMACGQASATDARYALGSPPVSSWLLGALVGGAACLVASPFLAWLAAAAHPSRPPLAATALIGAVLGVLAGHAAGWSAALPAFVAWALLATPLLLVDAREHRLPDRLMLPAAGCALALLGLAATVRGDWATLGRAVASAGVVFAIFCMAAIVSPSSLGFGDVKLAGVLALYLGWLGWGHVFYGIFAGFVLGALIAVVMLASRRVSLKSHIALGPALITGALLIAAVH